MEGKINRKKNFQFLIFNFKFPIFTVLFILLIYTRFVNIGWGLPFPMHPDERNMANAIQSMNCKIYNFQFPISKQITNCFNPHFFAYGQFPLYLGYILIWISSGFKNFGNLIINFDSAVISLRLISALASILNAYILIKIIDSILERKNNRFLIILIIVFSPFFIQFSHFGTTESMLMLFFSIIIFLSIKILKSRTFAPVGLLALISGLAVATKVSSVIFLIVPVISIIFSLKFSDKFKSLIKFGTLTIIFTLLFSPHNFINFTDFKSALNYESSVALGSSLVFYTRQFTGTMPVLFQFIKVFPYALGWPVFILGLMGLIGADWKDKKINLLRFAFLIYFIPSAIIYAKWSRFMAPVFPIVLVFAILFLEFLISNFKFLFKSKFQISNLFLVPITLVIILPGIAYLSVYQNPDIRFQVSDWIYKNIPDKSYILSETANVVDIPISNETMKQLNNYNVISFNFYDLDENPQLQEELKEHLRLADYIFVPSRRIFANLNKKYPLLNRYYDDLFSGKLGFEKVAEFESFPKICLPITNKCLIFTDEQAEETWTVFDHPVIRIFKKVKS